MAVENSWRDEMNVVLLGCALLVSVAASAAAQQADLYVSTAGNDAWSGRFAEPANGGSGGPVATLQRAKQLVAEIRRREPARDRPVVVAVRGGTYHLDQPLTFGPDDSGTEKSPTIYQAFGDERPLFSGGVRITRWHVSPEGWWRAKLDDVRAGKWSFAQLFVDDQRRYRPRLPKRGYYSIAEQIGRNQFRFAGNDIHAQWGDRSDVEVLSFIDWAAPRLRIASVLPSEHRVVFTGRSSKMFRTGDRYLIDNVREALNEPGEWYLDRSRGELTYIPKSGEQPDRTVAIAPRLEQLLVLQGDLANKRWIQRIEFHGLSFAHTNWTLPSLGQAFPQAEMGLNAAVVAIGARQVVFDGCVVRHTGGYAMAFGVGSRDNRVENCELVDLGGGGIKIGHAGPGTWESVRRLSIDPDTHVSHHVIRNCLIAHGGRLHPGSVGIWIGQSSYNTVEHNDIFDFYQTGISVGWTWGYGRSDAHHNDIGFNHIHTIGQSVTSDMGGIYTLGVQPGTIVHDNHVHDVQSFSYGGWGLHADEGSSDIIFERNLVYRTKTGGFFQHFGKDNQIQNNIFAFATQFQLEGTDPEPHVAFRLERNIVYWDNASPLMGGCHSGSPPCEINFKMDHNIYWADGAPPVFPGHLTFDEWRLKQHQDQHSLVADPFFVDPNKGNFQLKPSSPALKIGFQPIDATKAGRRERLGLTQELPTISSAFQ